ncbi:oligosaccharide flippase family protein [Cerasicoccus frondis]|uniref:oligosaccharide flippase family protein n=1 Tax=Cerasicoccus frondis TaxID=490090 RepID=UPI002852620A|nr:oligosaccharide flippase family protein [Cerasicoccus frondis]
MKVVTGIFAFAFSTSLSRLIAFGVQIVLGWYLSKSDYGLYGIAVSVTVIGSCFRGTSLQKLFIQQHKSICKLQSVDSSLSLLFAVVLSFLLTIGSFLYASARGEPLIIWLVMLIASSALLSYEAPACRAKLMVSSNYSSVARIDFYKNSLASILSVPLAMIGFGAFSFVVQRPLISILEMFAYWRLSALSFRNNVSVSDLGHYLLENYKSLIWLMLIGGLIGFLLNGDYMVLGLFVSPEVVGVYYFGFQLVAAFGNMISGAIIGNVLMPRMSSLVEDENAQRAFYGKALLAVLVVVYPIMFISAALIGELIEFIWGAKWLESVIVAQALLLIMPIRMSSYMLRAFFESCGLWKRAFFVMVINALILFIAAAGGAIIGSINAISIAMALAYLTYGLGCLVVSCAYIKKVEPCIVLSVIKINVIYALAFIVFLFVYAMGVVKLGVFLAFALIALFFAIHAFLIRKESASALLPILKFASQYIQKLKK